MKVDDIQYHLVAYCAQLDSDYRRLSTVNGRADIMALGLPSALFKFSEFKQQPKVEVNEDGVAEIV